MSCGLATDELIDMFAIEDTVMTLTPWKVSLRNTLGTEPFKIQVDAASNSLGDITSF